MEEEERRMEKENLTSSEILRYREIGASAIAQLYARTEKVDRNDSSVGTSVILDLIRRIEIFDVWMDLSVSPNGRHQLVAYRVVC